MKHDLNFVYYRPVQSQNKYIYNIYIHRQTDIAHCFHVKSFNFISCFIRNLKALLGGMCLFIIPHESACTARRNDLHSFVIIAVQSEMNSP